MLVCWFQLVNSMRFVQTAQLDERVRTPKLPEDVVKESMRYIIAHEIGHTLGLTHNMAASAAIPVEKYRDAEFMAKYGTTMSIMDYARYNYIAQPGDKGVKLTPPTWACMTITLSNTGINRFLKQILPRKKFRY